MHSYRFCLAIFVSHPLRIKRISTFFRVPFILIKPIKVIVIYDSIFTFIQPDFPERISIPQPPIQEYRCDADACNRQGNFNVDDNFNCHCVCLTHGFTGGFQLLNISVNSVLSVATASFSPLKTGFLVRHTPNYCYIIPYF